MRYKEVAVPTARLLPFINENTVNDNSINVTSYQTSLTVHSS